MLPTSKNKPDADTDRYKYSVTMKCESCGETLEAPLANQYHCLIDKFLAKDDNITFVHYAINQTLVSLHRCSNGDIGNCTFIKFNRISNKEDK